MRPAGVFPPYGEPAWLARSVSCAYLQRGKWRGTNARQLLGQQLLGQQVLPTQAWCLWTEDHHHGPQHKAPPHSEKQDRTISWSQLETNTKRAPTATKTDQGSTKLAPTASTDTYTMSCSCILGYLVSAYTRRSSINAQYVRFMATRLGVYSWARLWVARVPALHTTILVAPRSCTD